MEIDLELIKAYSMSTDEYVLLDLIRRKAYNKIRSYFSDRVYLQTCLDRLVTNGFLKLIEYGVSIAPQDYEILKLPIYSASVIDSMFEELLENYPKHVIRPDGVKDYLRVNTDRVRKMYKRITDGSKDKHELILACLKYQLALYVRTGKMAYMPKMLNWLINEEWERYKNIVLGIENLDNEPEAEIYGTQIVE